jgi:NAD-dependent SIR2 family protein deacetylase
MEGMSDIRNLVILTGAGISAESGLATFRGPGGLWEGHRVEKMWPSDKRLSTRCFDRVANLARMGQLSVDGLFRR